MKMNNNDIMLKHIERHKDTLNSLSNDDYFSLIIKIAGLCSSAISEGKKILFMGNGGSAADAQHLAAELVGRYLADRPALAAIALNVNTSILTAVSNDYSYKEIFSRQVEGLGNPGDVLIGLSTSGRSLNIIEGLRSGRKKGLQTVALVGPYIDDVKDLCDVVLAIPAKHTPIIQEMHIMAGHIICGVIENSLIRENDSAEN